MTDVAATGVADGRRFASWLLAGSGVWLLWGSFPFARVPALGLTFLMLGHLSGGLALLTCPRRSTLLLVVATLAISCAPWVAWTVAAVPR